MSTNSLIGQLLSIESRVACLVGRFRHLLSFLGEGGTVTGLSPPRAEATAKMQAGALKDESVEANWARNRKESLASLAE